MSKQEDLVDNDELNLEELEDFNPEEASEVDSYYDEDLEDDDLDLSFLDEDEELEQD